MSQRKIRLRGVRVNNLQDIDLDIPHGQFVSICGVSGSGKSSLAFETLFAEGQRRYFESLSTYTRQFLEQLDKPDADKIEEIPPAIALRANRQFDSSRLDRLRTTVGVSSEIMQHLCLLYSKIGDLVCTDCRLPVRSHNPDSVIQFLKSLDKGVRYQVCFDVDMLDEEFDVHEIRDHLRSLGFGRAIIDGKTQKLDEAIEHVQIESFKVVVDRLKIDGQWNRAADSLETAFRHGNQSVAILWQDNADNDSLVAIEIDSQIWKVANFYNDRVCTNCKRQFTAPDPGRFSYSNPLGACENCEGTGSVLKLDMNLIVPDDSISIRDGAIAAWNTPAYEHEKHELIELAACYGVDLDCPFSELTDKQLEIIWRGVPERDFGGFDGFFKWLERKKYKVQVAAFLNRWKSTTVCDSCSGERLQPDSLAYQIGGKNIFEWCNLEVSEMHNVISNLDLTDDKVQISARILSTIQQRLEFLQQVGLSYLRLNRSTASLSSGESQRVMLCKILGSTLTSMLYVLDEPTSGLHPSETQSLLQSLKRISSRGNTVVVVDHNNTMIAGAERIVEIGPGAGSDGGQIIFDGTVDQMVHSEQSVTGHFIKRHSGLLNPDKKRRKKRGRLTLTGAAGNNLKSIDVEFPLGCLCAVSGLSGSGKSTLIEDTLHPALQNTNNPSPPTSLPYDALTGRELVGDVVLVDQSPIGRSSRSNPVTYVKAFDEIRKTFAETVDAKTKNFKAGHFSFNVDGGRCEKCKGAGQLTIDMQFMSDIHVRCDQCQGTRFRDAVLSVKYRAKNIDEVLNMTAREAFTFFRGKTKVQTQLKALIDVGLDYIRLGQPASTLSSGEAQRLKLALYLNAPKTQKALFLMDEPTFGLHMRDILNLVDCFDTLLAAGHSIIVIEHNLHLLKHADWIIDLGPGAAKDGGNVVVAGTPEEVADCLKSVTGQHLRKLLDEEATSLQEVE